MASWTARWASALDALARGLGRRRKVRSTPFHETNGGAPFNASGVVQVGPGRFVFIDNHDPSALFELALDGDGRVVERISRRTMIGVADGRLRDPEGLTRVDHDGEILLVVASSLCVADGAGPGRRHDSDGLVRVRYTTHGELPAETMPGFRDWLLNRLPVLAAAAQREPDAGGLNVEGLAWDPRTRALLFGLRGPADPGVVTLVRIPVAAGVVPWTTAALAAPSLVRLQAPWSRGRQGVRDLTYDDRTGDFLVLLGRSTSAGDEPFQLCGWNGRSDSLRLLDLTFHRSMKPEGVVAFSGDGAPRLLIVDDRGGYAVVEDVEQR